MTKSEFISLYEDEIRDFGMEDISNNEEEYFDGYTSYSDEDYEEAFEENYSEIVLAYAEHIGVEITD